MSGDDALVVLCGPRAGGNSDTAGLTFAEGLAGAGIKPRIVRLRELSIVPCRGCGACNTGPGHRCPLTDGDDVARLFAAMTEARVLAFAAPIYFYHVPALFKALIDRAQQPYAVRMAATAPTPVSRPVHIMLVAGRTEGQRLFDGTLLTLKYFLWPFALHPGEPCLLRGMDAPGDVAASTEARTRLLAYGEAAALGR